MSLISGLFVALMGGTILWQRLAGRPGFGHHHHHEHDHGHDHTHGHEHEHHHHHGYTHSHGGHTHTHLPPGGDGSRITWRSLLALGISGGLLPCPSALVVLLGSIALGRVGFGMALVLAFSVGLAGALTGVGLLFLYAGRLLERRVGAARWTSVILRYAPIAGALVVTLVGVAMIVRAVGTTLG
jgi:ABC-type nickel/cobalt efflux system permease component RcnA